MNKKLLIGVAIVAVVATAVVGVMSDSVKKTAQTKKELPKINIAMVTFPGYAPLYVAKEKGFFNGVDVELKRIESIGDIRAAMRSGDINVYAATYDIYQSTKDVPPAGVGFLAIDESHGADGVAVAKNINSVKDLKNKKVGAEPGFPPYLVLQYLLDKEGMTLKDLDFKDMPTTDAGNAFAAGKLDAAGIYEPALSASVKARPGSKIFASSADVPGLVQDLLFADEKLAKENPEALQKIVEGWYKALDYINTNHDESYEIMAKAFGVTKAEMEDFKTGVSWINKDENVKLFDKNNTTNVYSTFSLICDILKKNGDTNICLPADDKLTDAIIKNSK